MVRLNTLGLIQNISPSVEWWNNQVDGWLYTMLWEPHYLCAVIACFTGFLILWDLEDDASPLNCLTSAAVAGAGFRHSERFRNLCSVCLCCLSRNLDIGSTWQKAAPRSGGAGNLWNFCSSFVDSLSSFSQHIFRDECRQPVATDYAVFPAG